MGPDFVTQLSDLPALPEAACRTYPFPDFFFPEDIRNFRARVRAASSAIAVCETCPIIDKCLEFGLRKENLRYGIYGGLLSGERMALANSRAHRSQDQIREARRIRAAFTNLRDIGDAEEVA